MPLTGAGVILSADIATDMNFGSGAVYYCSFGGNECIEWLSRHPEAKPIELLLPNGRFSKNAGKYEGQKTLEARKNIIEDLEKSGALVKLEPTKHAVYIHERCKTDVEYIDTKQWFIKILDLKKELKERGNELKWYPAFMKVHLDNWIDGLKWDWCISRDRFFGVPFPVWHCEDCGEIIAPEDEELPVDPREQSPKNKKCSKCQSQKIKGEMQVMDTWMTSSLTPLINARWKEKSNLMDKIYPMTLRVQAFEIIRTWLFYTLVKSHLHTNTLPWKSVMISGWGLAKDGEKMSKSLNNYVTAESMIEKYSADAVRFWSCGATLGMNLRFSEEDIHAGQKLLTKMWNAARFINMNLEGYDRSTKLEKNELEDADRWILAELQNLIREVTEQFENYEFAKAKNALEHFFWIKFTDNYIELVKGRLYGKDAKKKTSAQYTLRTILSGLTKLFAPILPHICEELYQQFIRNENDSISVHTNQWPGLDKKMADEKMLVNGKRLLEIICEMRKIKAEKGIKLYEKIKKLAIKSEEKDSLEGFIEDLKNISGAESIELSEKQKEIAQITK